MMHVFASGGGGKKSAPSAGGRVRNAIAGSVRSVKNLFSRKAR